MQTRNIRRLMIWAIVIVTFLIGMGISFHTYSSQFQKRQGELALFVAQEIINTQLEFAQRGPRYASPDNALVVHLEPDVISSFYLGDLNSYHILSAWIYEDDTLNPINRQKVEKVAQNRDIFIYVIAIRTMKKNEAIVDVLSTYPWNETFSSRGGDDSYWLLDYTGSEWLVEEKSITSLYD